MNENTQMLVHDRMTVNNVFVCHTASDAMM